jgi:AcrR family transcriptional regulator
MPTQRQRVPGAVRREQILAVATELFARQGFHGTTTRAIANQAGVKEIILFRLFPTKQDLYWAVIEAKCAAGPGLEGITQLLESGGDDHAVFGALAAGLIERNTQDTTLIRLLLFSALEAHELSERFANTYMAQFYDMLAGQIRRRIRAGTFRQVDPLLAARAFLGMIFQYVMAVQLFGAKPNHRQAAATFTDIWLKGIQR